MNDCFLYVSACESREILCFRIDARDGLLTLLGRTDVPGGTGASPHSIPLALSPDRRTMYAALRMPPYAISTFRIDENSGQLMHVSSAELADSVCYMNVDDSGKSLISVSHSGNKVLNNVIDGEAIVRSEIRQLIPDIHKAHSILFGIDSKCVYVAALGDNQIRHFRFDGPSGLLTNAEPNGVFAPDGAGPRHLALHPQLETLYCLNETNGTIDTYQIDQGGSLRHLHTISARPPAAESRLNERAADIHVTPNGRFLFTSERSHDTLAGFSIDQITGTPTHMGSWPTEAAPRGFLIHPNSQFLYCAGHLSGHIAVYSIDNDSGQLTLRSRTEAGSGPNWLEIVERAPLSPCSVP